jgi:hypothetical protein
LIYLLQSEFPIIFFLLNGLAVWARRHVRWASMRASGGVIGGFDCLTVVPGVAFRIHVK